MVRIQSRLRTEGTDPCEAEALVDQLESCGEEGKARAGDWGRLLDLLDAHGALPCVKIDLSIVRGLAYYTGFVYEAFERTGEGRAREAVLRVRKGPFSPLRGEGVAPGKVLGC